MGITVMKGRWRCEPTTALPDELHRKEIRHVPNIAGQSSVV
jgi:hypothetical protein